MDDKELETLLEQLEGWSQSVGTATEDAVKQVKNLIENNPKLPDNCPSQASMAELILRSIHKPLDEVSGILDMTRQHLFEHYGEKK